MEGETQLEVELKRHLQLVETDKRPRRLPISELFQKFDQLDNESFMSDGLQAGKA